MKKYIVLVLFLVLALSVIPINLQVVHGAETGKRIVTMVIYVNFALVDFDDFYGWVSAFPSNYTFILDNWGSLNATQAGWLKSQAELIPALSYMQAWTPAVRVSYIDSLLTDWKRMFGSYPKGIFSFQPDTFLVNYTAQKYGVEYWHGTCFDQYISDYMTQRGGWQLPYYASETHVLRPNTDDGGVAILPHETWDWVASFTDNAQILTHPLWGGIVPDAQVASYVLEIINRTLNGVSPFGYSTFMFEYDWVKAKNRLWITEEIIGNLTSWDNIELLKLGEVTDWFKATYDSTPTYRVNFQSPYSNATIDWYYSTDCRVARVGNYVVSFVDYAVQGSDTFLTTNATVDFESEKSATNCIDDSLNFTINALGGATLKAPVTTSSKYYIGDLANFKVQYYSDLELQEALRVVIPLFVFVIILVAVLIAFRRKIKLRKLFNTVIGLTMTCVMLTGFLYALDATGIVDINLVGEENRPTEFTPLVNVADYGFSLVWITDTQVLSTLYDWSNFTSWIAGVVTDYNVPMVVHTGDIVSTWNNTAEWEYANSSMGVLADAGVPYTWCLGNHDENGDCGATICGDYASFNAGTFSGGNYWFSNYGNRDTAVNFTFGSYKFLIVNLEFRANASVLGWFTDVMDASAGYNVIVAAHSYINSTGQFIYTWESEFKTLLDGYSNIVAVLCGHAIDGTAWNQNVNGREEIFFNRQTEQSDVARVLTFDMAKWAVFVRTYQFYDDSWCVDSANRFGFWIDPVQ